MVRPKSSLLTRIKFSLSMGLISGLGQVILYIGFLAFMWLSELFFPSKDIDIALDFNNKGYMQNPQKHGEHIYNVNKVDPSLDDEAKKPHLRRSKNSSRFNLDRYNSDVDLSNSNSVIIT